MNNIIAVEFSSRHDSRADEDSNTCQLKGKTIGALFRHHDLVYPILTGRTQDASDLPTQPRLSALQRQHILTGIYNLPSAEVSPALIGALGRLTLSNETADLRIWALEGLAHHSPILGGAVAYFLNETAPSLSTASQGVLVRTKAALKNYPPNLDLLNDSRKNKFIGALHAFKELLNTLPNQMDVPFDSLFHYVKGFPVPYGTAALMILTGARSSKVRESSLLVLYATGAGDRTGANVIAMVLASTMQRDPDAWVRNTASKIISGDSESKAELQTRIELAFNPDFETCPR